VPTLASQFEKEESKGFVIIGITDEAVDVVDKWIATKKKTGYPIVILDGALEKVLGVQHFPYTGVIDPDGNLTYAGDSPEGAIKRCMKTTKSGSIWPKKLMGAAVLLRSGKLGEAWAELQTLKSGLDDREQKVRDSFSTYVSTASADTVKEAQELFKKDQIFAAMSKVEPIANAKPELPATPDAVKLVADMKAVPKFDDEMKGGELYAAALAKESDQEYLDAVNELKKVIKTAEGTKIADVALKRAQDIISKGLPGYVPTCPKCNKTKTPKACEKHAKAVKL
jgi:hypothetical protein